MTALGLSLCGAAVLAAPTPRVGTRRMRFLTARTGIVGGTTPRRARHGAGSSGTTHAATLGVRPGLVGAAAAVLGLLAAGPMVGLAAGIAAAVVTRMGRDRARTRRLRAEADLMLETVTALTGELRAGGTPEAALWTAVQVSSGMSETDLGVRLPPGGSPGRIVGAAAATASLGGAVPAALRAASRDCPPQLRVILRHIAAGWQVSESSGASLGAVLDRVEDDLRARRRQARQVEAQLAGPRATGAMLAWLPGFGLLLGTAMGAHPVTMLVHTGAGQLALLAGVGLDALGVLWTSRLLRVRER